MKTQSLKATPVLILVALVVLFSIQNAKLVEVNFLFWSFQMSRIILILIVFGIGLLAGYLFAGHSRRKKR